MRLNYFLSGFNLRKHGVFRFHSLFPPFHLPPPYAVENFQNTVEEGGVEEERMKEEGMKEERLKEEKMKEERVKEKRVKEMKAK